MGAVLRSTEFQQIKKSTPGAVGSKETKKKKMGFTYYDRDVTQTTTTQAYSAQADATLSKNTSLHPDLRFFVFQINSTDHQEKNFIQNLRILLLLLSM